jgi:hypothetical protein
MDLEPEPYPFQPYGTGIACKEKLHFFLENFNILSKIHDTDEKDKNNLIKSNIFSDFLTCVKLEVGSGSAPKWKWDRILDRIHNSNLGNNARYVFF